MMFRSYSNTSEYFLRDYVAKAMVIMLFSGVKISCLRVKAHLIFHWCLYNNRFNHKNFNFPDCNWFKNLLFSTNSLAKLLSGQFVIGQFVIGQFVIGQFVIGRFVIGQFIIGQFVIGRFNKPMAFKVVV